MAHIGAIIDKVAGDDWVIERPVRDCPELRHSPAAEVWMLIQEDRMPHDGDRGRFVAQGEFVNRGADLCFVRFWFPRNITSKPIFQQHIALFYRIWAYTYSGAEVTIEKGTLIPQ